MQTTIKSAISFAGVGLHSGRPARMTVRPASAEYGIWFRRTDIAGRRPDDPGALGRRRDRRRFAPGWSMASGVSVSTVEHLMAALAGLRHPQRADRDRRPRSSDPRRQSPRPSCAGFVARGIRRLRAPIRAIAVLEPVEVRDGDAVARLDPADGAGDRLPHRLRRCRDRPPGQASAHGQRRLRARTVRQPHLLPPVPTSTRCTPMAWRWAARWKTPSSSMATGCCQPWRAAPRRRGGAPQDAGRAGRSGAGRRRRSWAATPASAPVTR